MKKVISFKKIKISKKFKNQLSDLSKICASSMPPVMINFQVQKGTDMLLKGLFKFQDNVIDPNKDYVTYDIGELKPESVLENFLQIANLNLNNGKLKKQNLESFRKLDDYSFFIGKLHNDLKQSNDTYEELCRKSNN